MKMLVSVTHDHPNGIRYRAGMAFSRKVSEVEVTKAQAAAILADPYLNVEADTRKPAEDVVVVTEILDPHEVVIPLENPVLPAELLAQVSEKLGLDAPATVVEPKPAEDDAPAPTEPEPKPDFEGMTIKTLRAYAEEHAIDLGTASLKADIIAALQ